MQDEDLANRVAELLSGRAIATAESCTAGRVAEVLACVEQASDFLRGGVVAYQEAVNATCWASPLSPCSRRKRPSRWRAASANCFAQKSPCRQQASPATNPRMGHRPGRCTSPSKLTTPS